MSQLDSNKLSLSLALVFVWAVDAGSNTILSAGNLGEPGAGVDARSIAMGGTAIGGFDGFNVNSLNPATPASYGRAVFNLTLTRGYNSYETDFGRSVEVSYDAPGAELTVPVSSNTTTTIRFAEKFNRNYEYTRPLYSDEGLIGISRRTGKGAVYELGGSVAFSPAPAWLAGLGVYYNFGAPKDVYTKDFYKKGYSDITETIETAYSGFVLRGGAGLRLDARLTVGCFVEGGPPWRLDAGTYTDYATLRESRHSLKPPWAGGFGTAFKFGPRGVVTTDVTYGAWSVVKVDAAACNFRDVISVRAGAEGRLSTARKTFLLWRIPYRIGAFYEPWYDASAAAPSRVGMAVGAGYPFLANEESRLDFALEYSRRGSLGTNGVREEFYNVYISVVGLETWLGRKSED